MTTPTQSARKAARKYALDATGRYTNGSAIDDAYLAGAAFGAAHAQADVDEWKKKYIDARSSGYQEGKEEMLEDVLKALRSTHGQLASAVWWADWLERKFKGEK